MFHCLKRNKSAFWFATYVGKVEDIDSDGNYTGDDHIEYSEPIETTANISEATGYSDIQVFGADLKYDKVIVFTKDNPANDIDEYSVLWVDAEPYKNGVLQPHDYYVSKIARSHDKREISVAIRRVNRNETDQV